MRARTRGTSVVNLKGGDVIRWQEQPHVVMEARTVQHLTVLKLQRCAADSFRADAEAWPFKTRPLLSSTCVDLYEGGR